MIAAWDLLASVLVLFPLLTGGVWVQRPGLFIELSDLAIPTLIVGLFGLLLSWLSYPLLERSLVLKLGRSAWERWSLALERRPRATLLAATLAVALLWACAALRRHWALGSHACDLGLHANAIWNFAHGFGLVCTPEGGIPLLTDHQTFTLFALAPFARWLPPSELLLVLQAIALAAGGWAAWALARAHFPASPGARPHWATAAIPLLYWCYQPVRNAGLSDFHADALMVAPFFWGLALLAAERPARRALGALLLLVAMAAKESAPAAAAGIGLAWALGAAPPSMGSGGRRAGLALALAGVAGFALDMTLVPRFYRLQGYFHTYEFADFGPRLSDLLLSPVLHPLTLLRHLGGRTRFEFLFWTLAPLGFLPLLSPAGFVAALPGYLSLFLASAAYRITIVFHYGVAPAIGLFVALPGALRRGERLAGRRRLALWLLFWALAAGGRATLFSIRGYSPDAHARWVRSELVPSLAPDVSVTAAEALVPHLAGRHWVSFIPALHLPSGDPVDCAVEDFGLRNFDMSEAALAGYRADRERAGLRKVFECQGLAVYQREGARCLAREPRCP